MKKIFFIFGFVIGISIVIFFSYTFFKQQHKNELEKPSISTKDEIKKPLEKYSFENLSNYQFQTNEIEINEVINQEENYESYLFFFQSLNKKISGVINVPILNNETQKSKLPIIIMNRGWAPVEQYYSGMGTKNAAAYYAKQGFITFSLDFLGYGQSDPAPEDSWEARFIKPINVIELLETIKTMDEIKIGNKQYQLDHNKIGMWGHSNGGQISISVLEITSEPIPTVLWAPVTAPFPYSILYFSYDLEDEGKEMRKWLAMFEKKYDVYDFSITQHIDRIQGKILLHHGQSDFDAPVTWSRNFQNLIKAENNKRTKNDQSLIDLTYYEYPNTDHNLVPNWDKVVQTDVEFFNQSFATSDKLD